MSCSKRKIVEAIKFDTSNPDFTKEMILEVTFTSIDDETQVTFLV